ncbi:hypothetical protein CHS0354_003479 [Potamilus streckersoni]|uniref:Uncharacterized protein n=1 Tax=Potamilus streckersoni TaxID=2493646 RepID=A0AAE0SU93_9BIVA|nr:hypothetical protein CHS0354_003479 [Potamilus streckersoni]
MFMKRSLTYPSLLLSLLLLQHPSCIQTRHLAASKTKTMLDDLHIQKSVLLKGGKYTIGNTPCRKGNTCGRNQDSYYSWCYTANTWDYCCETPCEIGSGRGSVTRCMSGAYSYRCSAGLEMTGVDGTPCLPTHPCGFHEFLGTEYYWCYIDTQEHYTKCCNPHHGCANHSYSYNWCYYNLFFPGEGWDFCIPK